MVRKRSVLSRLWMAAVLFFTSLLFGVSEPARASDAESAEGDTSASASSGGPAVKFGGALRFNYFIKSWEGEEDNRDRFGDIAFDTFRVNVDGSWGIWRMAAEYRFSVLCRVPHAP